MIHLKHGLIIIGLILTTIGSAQDFVYTPKNPSFGGNTFNYQWMLSSAQAQDTYKAPSDGDDTRGGYYNQDPIKNFSESLNRQLLSRLSRELVAKQFGEEALSEGTYLLGDFQIEIGNDDGGMNISILDNTTGATTNVVVPHF
ncbi:curli production assembly/transport component CsgF [Carboxylicivirga marina]|uniref:Curli production assembly/transport component CsgF n=1 Tax=Carboxylicivirga marina TaxID=2800988 RepID=A0ABS1HH09_9BACT|nr:curli production assembly/transport component CsgF [Carboxylicivirga marina]MBK3516948.1 curli assembly protein CsgF [Carboxylicivirga marina]